MSYYGGQRVVVVDPNSPFAQGALFVFSCGILYLLGYFFWMFLSQWGTYQFPLNYSVGFYYFMVSGFVGLFTTPYDWGREIYRALEYFQITPYENLNTVLILSVEAVYTVIAAFVVYKILSLIAYLIYTFRFVRWMIYLPAIIGSVSFFILWLFEKPL
ncbi:hypothetical protein [Aeromonas rivipollensis]|uniref:hypothetical protein n=1 Tax=Aeromonas rivipollensis TaxID=948519 RepID=UPI0038D1C3A8